MERSDVRARVEALLWHVLTTLNGEDHAARYAMDMLQDMLADGAPVTAEDLWAAATALYVPGLLELLLRYSHGDIGRAYGKQHDRQHVPVFDARVRGAAGGKVEW